MSYYPVVRHSGKDTKYSNAIWIILGLIAAGVVFVIARDLDTKRTVVFMPAPDTTVWVDGEERRLPCHMQLEVGPHSVEVKRSTKAKQSFTIEVTDEDKAQTFVIERDGEAVRVRRL